MCEKYAYDYNVLFKEKIFKDKKGLVNTVLKLYDLNYEFSQKELSKIFECMIYGTKKRINNNTYYNNDAFIVGRYDYSDYIEYNTFMKIVLSKLQITSKQMAWS